MSARHASDCATHNAPATEPGPCDCGAPIPSKDEYPFVAIHVGGCEGAMFFLKRRPDLGDLATSAGIINPDGTPIERESAMQCHACGQHLRIALTDWVRPRE